MWAKLILAALFGLMILGALHFRQQGARAVLGAQTRNNASARLMTWNIGYAELEADTRAHTEDLPAIAETILRAEPDAVALQELTGTTQLRALLALLHGRYTGSVAQQGQSDRYEAVLVKGGAQFAPVAAGARYALGATFKPRADSPEVVLVSAHADAFNAARRRAYTEAVVDWAHIRTPAAQVFIAGDFNFELRAGDETNLYTDNLKHDSEAYSYLLRYFRDLGRDAGDTAINDRRIDYIFGPIATARVRRAEVLHAAAVGRMDHWPVVIEVEL